MPKKGSGNLLVRDQTAREQFRRTRELDRLAAHLEEEIARLLAPVRERLSELVLERDRLLYESIVARQKFFAAAKKAYPELEEHRSLRYQVRGEKLYITWEDSGPHFAIGEGAELPQLHPFVRRRPGRRAWDLIFWLR